MSRAAAAFASGGKSSLPSARQLESYVVLGHRSYRNQVEVLLHSSESGQGLEGLSPDLHWAMTDASTAQAFGDITAVPTLFLFNRSGKTSRVVYGAPPDLHDQVETSLDALVE